MQQCIEGGSALQPDSLQSFPLDSSKGNGHQPRHYSFQYDEPSDRSRSILHHQHPSSNRSLSRQSRRKSTTRPLADFTEESSTSEEERNALTVSQALNRSLQHLNLEQAALSRRKASRSEDLRESQMSTHGTQSAKQRKSSTQSRADLSTLRPPLPSRSLSYHGQHLDTPKGLVSAHVDRYNSSTNDSEEGEQQHSEAPNHVNVGRKLLRSITAAGSIPFSRAGRSRTRRGPSLALDHGKAVVQHAMEASKKSMELTSLAYKQEKDLQDASERHLLSVQSAHDAREHLWLQLRRKLSRTLHKMADQVGTSSKTLLPSLLTLLPQGHVQFCVQVMTVVGSHLRLDLAFEARCQMSYIGSSRPILGHLCLCAD